MDPLSLLRSLLRHVKRPRQTAADEAAPLPPHTLRYVLEFIGQPDPAAQALRLVGLLGSDAFTLAPLSNTPSLGNFLTLQFPGLEPSLPQRDLFAIGHALADGLGLVSAEPDLGSGFYTEPQPPAADCPGTEAARVRGLCWADGDPPADRLWALRSAGILDAWVLSQGAGIVIAQPDTGVAQHDDIDADMLALGQAADIIDRDTDPTDPLDAQAANPGHGTGTASVLASRSGGGVTGAAPAARVAPIRCITDVKVFNAAPVAAAIAHAVASGCHVISMSLGGVPSRALHAAVRAAEAADLITVAASGNCFPSVVWPARYGEVIAVAATNFADQPWKGASCGGAVDISAPGEFVWRAERRRPNDPTDSVGAGQGTSFATALVAGIAALWLAHHGRDAVVQAAHQRGISVQRLFRAALQASARRPAGWDSEKFGAGIASASALLALPLASAPIASHEAALDGAAPSAASVRALLDETLGPAPADPGFAWARFESEVATIALAQAGLHAGLSQLTPEAKTAATRPSPALSAAAAASTDARLNRFAERPGITSVSRPLAPYGAAVDPRRLQLALPKATGLESAGGALDLLRARDYLRGSGRNEQLHRMESLLQADAAPESAAMRGQLLADADQALAELARGEHLSNRGLVGLEALVRLTGRPALRMRQGGIDLLDPRASEWRDRLFLLLNDGRFKRRAAAVGRIDADGVHMGTGFVVGSGCVLTNRHVLQTFAAPVPRRQSPDHWVLTSSEVTIDFADAPSASTGATRFRILSVRGAGPQDIAEMGLDFSCLDAALLEVEPVNAAGTALPPCVPMVDAASAATPQRELLVVGYPARPQRLPEGADGLPHLAVVNRLNELYGAFYGQKYVSPGIIDIGIGGIGGDSQGWVISHDATTLGGNSGSCLIGFDHPVSALGLHFGGGWLHANYAHALSALRRDGKLFAAPGLCWAEPDQ